MLASPELWRDVEVRSHAWANKHASCPAFGTMSIMPPEPWHNLEAKILIVSRTDDRRPQLGALCILLLEL